MTNKPHSADVLNDLRDYWWSPEFIDLMAKRWNLTHFKSMLDVGCGIGHWGQMLAAHLPTDAKIIGIDPEATWIQNATERAQQKGLSSKTDYLLGTAENIPFPDNYFDMVSCQTVLIHLKDVSIGIKEMLRVLKPGGLLLVAEPNNLVSDLVFNNLNFKDSVDDIIDRLRFSLICERGRETLGKGNVYRGDLIPSYFYNAGLNNIQVYLSDTADYFIPPYDTPREKLTLLEADKDSKNTWDQIEQEMRSYFLAGGGSQDDFEKYWALMSKNNDRILQGFQNKTLCAPGGLVLYLISGLKPLI